MPQVTIVQLSEEESREIELKYPLIILFAPAKDLSSSPISDKSAITLGGDNWINTFDELSKENPSLLDDRLMSRFIPCPEDWSPIYYYLRPLF